MENYRNWTSVRTSRTNLKNLERKNRNKYISVLVIYLEIPLNPIKGNALEYSKNLLYEYFSKPLRYSTRYRWEIVSFRKETLIVLRLYLVDYFRPEIRERFRLRESTRDSVYSRGRARRIEKALVRRVRLFEDETESRVFGKRSARLFEVPRSGRELFWCIEMKPPRNFRTR